MSSTTRLHPSDAVFATGSPEEQRQARDEYRQQQRLQAAMRSAMQELERSDLEFGRFHITHRPTGQLYHVTRGEQFAGQHDTATAYYVSAGQEVVFLEPPNGPKSVDELEQVRAQQAERERRDNAPKPRPAWMA